jgi:arylamine N-acetyltransferase
MLDVTLYSDSIRLFMDFYNIPRQRPGELLLGKLLESFTNLPYENISKIIKWNEHFDQENFFRFPEEVMTDHIDYHLGGTCFSLTFFLQTILIQNGFQCYPVTADMRAGKNIHCALIVLMAGNKYLVDPGYLLNKPMLIDPRKTRQYRTEHTGIELLYDFSHRRYHLYTFIHEEIKWRYSFEDKPAPPEKFLHHWQESFYRNSMHGLCLTKIKKDGLIYIHKNFMRETNLQGKKNYNIRQQYHDTIHSIFGIDQQLIEQALTALDENMKRERIAELNSKNDESNESH